MCCSVFCVHVVHMFSHRNFPKKKLCEKLVQFFQKSRNRRYIAPKHWNEVFRDKCNKTAKEFRFTSWRRLKKARGAGKEHFGLINPLHCASIKKPPRCMAQPGSVRNLNLTKAPA